MTVRYVCDVFCDRCGNWINGAVGEKAPGLATKALQVAKRMGWSRDVRSTYTDLCPHCLEENRKEPK